MTVQEALSIDFLRADKTTLRQMNKILTRKINRQMIGLAYNDIGMESKALEEVQKTYGGNTVKLGNKYTFNQLKAHVGFIQRILNRQDSSVRTYKKYIGRIPEWMTEEQKEKYSKMTLQEKREFWKYFDELKTEHGYYNANTLTDSIMLEMEDDSEKDFFKKVKKIGEEYEKNNDDRIANLSKTIDSLS